MHWEFNMVRHVVAFMAILQVMNISAQPPVEPGSAYRASIQRSLEIYLDPVVQDELKLTDDQKKNLSRIPDELMTKHKDAIAKELALNQENTARRDKLRSDFEQKLQGLLEKHLTADQRKRVEQLTLQAMGQNVFFEPGVAKALNLSQDSLAKLSEIRQESLKKLRSEFPAGPLGGAPEFPTRTAMTPEYMAARFKYQQEMISKFVATLSEEQQKSWRSLIGEASEHAAKLSDNRQVSTRFGFVISPRSKYFWLPALFDHEAIRKQLKISAEARTAMTDGFKALEESTRQGNREAIEPALNSTSIFTTLFSEATERATAILTPPQVKRLAQLRLQLRGTQLLSTPMTRTRGQLLSGENPVPEVHPALQLNLTPGQVRKIETILADNEKKVQLLRDPGIIPGAPFGRNGETAEEKALRLDWQNKWFAREQDSLAAIVATFDIGQQNTWNELVGRPVNWTKSELRPAGLTPFGLRWNLSPLMRIWTNEISTKIGRQEYAAALALCDDAIRSFPQSVEFRQSKANLLASCPSEWVRDGKQALELMKDVLKMSKESDVVHDTLAKAYAEVGQFDEAVKAQETALALLPKPQPVDPNQPPAGPFGVRSNFGQFRYERQKTEYEARLKLYQDKKPYRLEPPRNPGFPNQ